MTEKWPEASRSLRRAKASAERRLAEIEKERREIKASMKSLDAALRALGKNEGTEGTPSKTAATTAEVITLLTQILHEQSGVSVVQLTKLVGDRLAAAGRSLAGLKLRVPEALKDSRFHESSNGYELAADQDGDSSIIQSDRKKPGRRVEG